MFVAMLDVRPVRVAVHEALVDVGVAVSDRRVDTRVLVEVVAVVMAVAVDVLSGAADCGMGIYAAAKALDLDFIPVEREQYDLIIPAEREAAISIVRQVLNRHCVAEEQIAALTRSETEGTPPE